MQAGIITIFDTANYGNRLQNYAVQKILNKMGVYSITYACEKETITGLAKIKYMIHKIFQFRLAKNSAYWKGFIPRTVMFDKFNDEFIVYKRYRKIEEIDSQLDYFVLGSDQVWNPLWYDEEKCKKEAFLLTFAENSKKVCFAPSFGIQNIPEKWKKWFKLWLGEFKYISVREDEGKKIVKELTGKDAEVLIDPTLMLDKEEWMEIAKKPKKIDLSEEYILLYFLGTISNEVKKQIDEVARRYKLRIINIMDDTNLDEYINGPSEFVYLISKAKIVMTDSFHACVFSFLFDKPFIVYERNSSNMQNMMSRIETFLNKFSLERKKVGDGFHNNLFKTGYSEGYLRLKEEREAVRHFLKISMNL